MLILHDDRLYHHHHRVASLGRSVAPCPRLMALRHKSAREMTESGRMCSSQLLRGWSGLRFHEWWGGRPSDASTWQHRAWLAGTASDRRDEQCEKILNAGAFCYEWGPWWGGDRCVERSRRSWWSHTTGHRGSAVIDILCERLLVFVCLLRQEIWANAHETRDSISIIS